MKNVKTIATLALAGALFTACKKNLQQTPGLTATPDNVKTETAKTGIPVEQKVYDLPTTQAIDLIKSFKAGHNSTSKVMAADSLDADSSIYLVEATLNFEYDYSRPDARERKLIHFERAIQASGNVLRVNSNEFETTVYLGFKAALDSVVNDTFKLEVVDISAYFESTSQTITYKATASMLNKYIANPCSQLALPASPWRSKYLSFGCGNTPSADGPKLVNQRLNCMINGVTCYGSYFYSNVYPGNWSAGSSGLSTSAYPNALFSTAGLFDTNNPNPPYICATGVISAAQMNTFKTGCYNLVNNANINPSFYETIYGTVIPVENLCVCFPPASAIYWDLASSYGHRNCYINDN